MFADDPSVRIPAVHAEQTTRKVLTLEDVYYIKITDYAAIEAAGVSRKDVARRLFRTYMHQIFEVGFFHADPHPGNLFVEPANGPSAIAGANGPSAIAGASEGPRTGWRLRARS